MAQATSNFIWLDLRDIRAIHLQQIERFGGGGDGIRDVGALESAAARPKLAFGYGVTDIFDLAALHCAAISRNHPFVDGNKRTAWVAMRLFLILNGYTVSADDYSKTTQMLRFAAGNVSDDAMAQWLRENTQPA